MIDPELLAKLDEIGAKVDRAYFASERVRTYLFWSGIAALALVVIPAIALVFAVPVFIDSYTSTLGGI